jgi:hypothetical protein
MLLIEWQRLTAAWRGAFLQARTHERALVLALGLLCGTGRKTITCALGFWDREQQDWSAEYRFFSQSPWQAVELFDPLLQSALERYGAPDQPIPVALDDTVLERTGRLVPNSSWQRDPQSPPFQVNLIWGQRFMQASLMLPLYRQEPSCSARGLPVRFVECPVVRKPGKQASQEEQAEYKKAQQAHNLSQCFVTTGQEARARLDAQGYRARWLLLTGDGSFCNRTVFRAQWERTHVLCRARKDLSLCFRHQGPGRRFYGEEKFSPQEVYKNGHRPWREARIFYGGRRRVVRYKEVKRVLWQGGAKRRELRLLVVAPTPYRRTKHGYTNYRQKAFLLTDDLETNAQVLLQAYFDHFQIEFNHRDEKSILGVGQAQVWAKQSAPREPEFVVAAYSALLLASLQAYGPKRTAAYAPLPKWRRAPARRPSCQDLVNLLREQVEQAARAKSPNAGYTVEEMALAA